MRRTSGVSKLDAKAMMRAMEQLRNYIKREGLNASEVRETVARAALEMDGHFGTEALATKLPSAHTSTVYRTVPLLVDAGLLRLAPSTHEGQQYERAFERERHDHLVCTRCGCIAEFQLEDYDAVQRRVALRFDFLPTDHVHQIYGICRDCRKVPRQRRAIAARQ